MEDTLDDFIEWLRVLKLPEEDFRRHIRGYFDDTAEMEQYIADRAPQEFIRYKTVIDETTVSFNAPTKPYTVQAVTQDDIPAVRARGHYKGRRRKRLTVHR